MKQVIAIMTILSVLISSAGFASQAPSKQVNLAHRMGLMLNELETQQNSPVIEKLILSNIVTAYSNSNIKDVKLKDRIDSAIVRLSPALSKKEEAFFNRQLAKIN